MKLSMVTTGDGSVTFRCDETNEHYHSVKGAVSESEYVFIEKGLKEYHGENINIFEVGFGTGLNAFLTLIHAKKLNIKVQYTSIELFPLNRKNYEALNYIHFYPAEFRAYLGLMHQTVWGEKLKITEDFQLLKIKGDITRYCFNDKYDLVYFDAFSLTIQPEMWTGEIFRKVFYAMKNNGTLVTYSASGKVRRAMESEGFMVEKLIGPPGKRHMLRAKKNC